jgi:hypothetical protein
MRGSPLQHMRREFLERDGFLHATLGALAFSRTLEAWLSRQLQVAPTSGEVEARGFAREQHKAQLSEREDQTLHALLGVIALSRRVRDEVQSCLSSGADSAEVAPSAPYPLPERPGSLLR